MYQSSAAWIIKFLCLPTIPGEIWRNYARHVWIQEHGFGRHPTSFVFVFSFFLLNSLQHPFGHPTSNIHLPHPSQLVEIASFPKKHTPPGFRFLQRRRTGPHHFDLLRVIAVRLVERDTGSRPLGVPMVSLSRKKDTREHKLGVVSGPGWTRIWK